MCKARSCRVLAAVMCVVATATSCRRDAKEAVAGDVQQAVPPGASRVGMQEVSLPLRVMENGREVLGKALLARIQVGASKKGGGFLGRLNPALQVDGAVVQTDGDSLSILADLPVALKMLVRIDAIEFRGLLVLGRDGRELLECASASVGKDRFWQLRHVRRNGGPMEVMVRLDPSNSGEVAERVSE
jgi:hypothetical protein